MNSDFFEINLRCGLADRLATLEFFFRICKIIENYLNLPSAFMIAFFIRTMAMLFPIGR